MIKKANSKIGTPDALLFVFLLIDIALLFYILKVVL